MLKDIIEQILIIWDPYQTIGYGPINEYNLIRDEIVNILEQEEFSVAKLTKYLNSIDVSHGTTKEKIDTLVALFLTLKSQANYKQ